MKSLIKTKSFELAIFSKGDNTSTRLALLLPGRMDTKDYFNFVSHADYLAELGFFVVSFDPPGTWESPGSADLFTTTNYIKATNELIEYFENKPTLLLGHSRGAAVAILVGVSNKNVIGIIPIMANYGIPTAPSQEDIERGFRLERRDLPPGTSKTEEKKGFLLPLTYWEDGKKYDIISSIKSCTKPKLLIYGTKDEFTKPEEVKNLYEIIPEPKMLKEVNSTHDYRYYPEVIKEVEKEIGKFLDKYFEK